MFLAALMSRSCSDHYSQTATTHSEQQSTLEQKRAGQQDFVEQDVNSGTARVGNASANNGNEGSYPIPPQKNKD